MVTNRFAVDKMLGRLATWLRVIGQDVSYGSHLSRRTLIRHARLEGRIILTRDHRVLRDAGDVPVIWIFSNDFRHQLRQVITHCGVDPNADLFSRCVRCNTAVVPVPRSEVAHRVPPYVFGTQAQFACCPSCRRLYWSGTHAALIRAQLQQLS